MFQDGPPEQLKTVARIVILALKEELSLLCAALHDIDESQQPGISFVGHDNAPRLLCSM
jgi:hypothetical protein